MKVIKKGKPTKVIRATCKNCKAVLEEQEHLLKWETDRDGRMAQAECPECKGVVFFY
jgi:RNase P subunit RPR2